MIVLPRISVITPSYNQGNFIEDTIRSVVSQGYPNLEYIIVDGGSRDKSVSIIEKWSRQIDFWVSEKDSGMSNALNKGFSRAKGELLGWINSDDTYLPRTLFYVARAFIENPNVEIVYGDFIYTDSRNKPLRWKRTPKILDRRVMLFENLIGQPASFFRRELIKKIGFIDENLSYEMDWDFYIRALHGGARFYHVPRYLATYRIHRESKSSKEGLKRYDQDLKLIEKRGRIAEFGNNQKSLLYFCLRIRAFCYRVYTVVRDNPINYFLLFRYMHELTIRNLVSFIFWRMKH